MRHFLEIDDLTPPELEEVLGRAAVPEAPALLAGRGMALVFEKPSARTRHSMEMAVVQLGGHPVYVQGAEVGMDERESVEDVARTLACYHAAVGARVFAHRTVERMAAVSAVPIVNLLSDQAHPMQALADLLTIRQEVGGELAGRTLAWVGDANNVCRSLCLGAAMSGMKVRVATPAGYGFGARDLERLRRAGDPPLLTTEPASAVAGADVVCTDVWVSMGQERQAERRRADFAPYQVSARLLELAAPTAVFLHCLPAHRGQEVEADVVDGPRSRVWVQATNRMHAARGLLWFLLEPGERAVPGGPSKTQRQHRIARLLAEQPVSSQAQLVDLLGAAGIVATQATVSRDLDELGAIKVRVPGGDLVYAIPELPTEQMAPQEHLRRVLGDWAVAVNPSGNLVLLRTPPGSAHVVASALDRAGLDGVLGTVAGDDTLLVIVAEGHEGRHVADKLRDLAGL